MKSCSTRLIQNLQQKNADTINKGDNKNSFGCIVPVGIDINGE